MTDQPTPEQQLATIRRKMAAPSPTPEQAAQWDAADRAMADRIHAARPGVPTHQAFATLQTLRTIQRLDKAGGQPTPDAFPRVQGRCPACGFGGLFLGAGGYVTCPRDVCPAPDAASSLLDQQPHCTCGHPVHIHSAFGCAMGCGCEALTPVWAESDDQDAPCKACGQPWRKNHECAPVPECLNDACTMGCTTECRAVIQRFGEALRRTGKTAAMDAARTAALAAGAHVHTASAADGNRCDSGECAVPVDSRVPMTAAELGRMSVEAHIAQNFPVPDNSRTTRQPLRGELKPWQLLGTAPDGPAPETERLTGGRRLAPPDNSRTTADNPAPRECGTCNLPPGQHSAACPQGRRLRQRDRSEAAPVQGSGYSPAQMLGADNPAGHRYLSTGCLHGEHAYCQGKTGRSGAKAPAQCKFCAAPCTCPCHQEQPPVS